jgi:hypothetical protein
MSSPVYQAARCRLDERELYVEVIVGARRRISRVRLAFDPPERATPIGNDRCLLLGIDARVDFTLSPAAPLARCALLDHAFQFRFPAWMDARLDPATWRSQSESGALYLSRTDLYPTFGVSGVLLVQLLWVNQARPCFTSLHKHHHTRELFDPLDPGGESEYRRGNMPWRPLHRRIEIPPGELHQLRRLAPGVSLNMLQMYGPYGIVPSSKGPLLDMTDHDYLDEA